MLHELPREQGKSERGSIPIDRRLDIDGFQYGEQVSLLVVQRGEQRSATTSKLLHFSTVCKARFFLN